MKQIILLLLFFSIGCTSTFCQDSEPKRNQIGASLAINHGRHADMDNKSKIGYSGSIIYSRLSLSNKRKFEIDLTYSRINYESDKTYKSYSPLSDTFIIATRNADLLETYINYNGHLFSLKKIKFNLLVGCGVSTILQIKRESRYYATSDGSFLYDTDPIKYTPFDKFLVCFQTGLEVEIPWKNDFSFHFQPTFCFRAYGVTVYNSKAILLGMRKSF